MPKSQLLAAAFVLLMTAGAFSQAAETPQSVPSQLAGMAYTEPSPAPDFTLTDQHGSAFRMSSTRGKVVVLTFIYTHCTDVCPFISLKLKQALALLGKDAGRVAFVAVTTDPARDTVPVIAAYSREVGLFNTWHFLTGPAADVKAVWDRYQVGVDIEKAAPSAPSAPSTPSDMEQSGQPETEHAQGLKPDDLRLASQIIGQFGGGYEVSHTVPFWIIDRRGNFRAILDADATPQDIAGDARLLMAEK